MRIAINAWFLNRPDTGSGQYLHGLLRAMPAVAAQDRFLLVAPPDAGAFHAPGLQIERWPLRAPRRQSNLGKVLFEQIAFPRICRRWGADVAHVPYWGSPLVPTVPTVVTIHDIIPRLLPAYRGSSPVRLYTHLVSASARRAQAVLTDSQASRQDIITHLGLPEERVRTVYLGADPKLGPHPTPEDPAIRRRYGLPDRYVLYLAGHDVRKNVAALLRAFAVVARADDDVALAIGGKLPTGNDPLFFDPRPLTAELGLEERVRFIGWVEESHKAALYRGAACAVFVSRYEGFGLPVLEALACGAPLVTSDVSSLPELLGDAGFAVDPDDEHALAGAILSCLVDEDLAAELRLRGPQQAARFTWRRTAEETLAVYRSLRASA